MPSWVKNLREVVPPGTQSVTAQVLRDPTVLLKMLQEQMDIINSPYSSMQQQAMAGTNLAGSMLTGSMPAAPMSRGGILGTAINPIDPQTLRPSLPPELPAQSYQIPLSAMLKKQAGLKDVSNPPLIEGGLADAIRKKLSGL